MTFDQKPHPANEVLEEYSLQRLSAAECDRIEDHLLLCEQCQEELIRIETFIRDMKVVCGVPQTKVAPSGESLLGRWLTLIPRPAMVAAFAAVVLAVGIPMMRDSERAASPLAVHSPLAVQLTVMRGRESTTMATAEQRRPLQLRISAAELPEASTYRLQIVNQSGTPVWSGQPRSEADNLIADVSASLSAGTYWVRLFTSGTDPVREFGLVLK
jgi:hypothetical protein